jgi:hypothetical protein
LPKPQISIQVRLEKISAKLWNNGPTHTICDKPQMQITKLYKICVLNYSCTFLIAIGRHSHWHQLAIVVKCMQDASTLNYLCPNTIFINHNQQWIEEINLKHKPKYLVYVNMNFFAFFAHSTHIQICPNPFHNTHNQIWCANKEIDQQGKYET